jgi:hypothetical protein
MPESYCRNLSTRLLVLKKGKNKNAISQQLLVLVLATGYWGKLLLVLVLVQRYNIQHNPSIVPLPQPKFLNIKSQLLRINISGKEE